MASPILSSLLHTVLVCETHELTEVVTVALIARAQVGQQIDVEVAVLRSDCLRPTVPDAMPTGGLARERDPRRLVLNDVKRTIANLESPPQFGYNQFMDVSSDPCTERIESWRSRIQTTIKRFYGLQEPIAQVGHVAPAEHVKNREGPLNLAPKTVQCPPQQVLVDGTNKIDVGNSATLSTANSATAYVLSRQSGASW